MRSLGGNSVELGWPLITRDAHGTDEDRVDAAVLALLYLTLDRDGRAWKGFDWSVMNRLHDKGMIHNPVGKAKSVPLTEEGITESERLFREMFAKTI